ncbi:MAG TPA: hypothetical protein VN326_01505 [Casimicrobiaceae bacterium]|nr:hypothetical protein [Casimicrobiaceae bacterium]
MFLEGEELVIRVEGGPWFITRHRGGTAVPPSDFEEEEDFGRVSAAVTDDLV